MTNRMVSTKRSVSFLLAAQLLLQSSVAFAQSDDAMTKAARARFVEGVAQYDKGQFEAARASFLQAYALKKHPAVLLNIGQSSLKSDHAVDAAKAFQQFLRESQDIKPKQRADADKGLSEALRKVGRVEVSAPIGAEILLGDERVGTAPLAEAIIVEPGTHSIKMRMPDGATDMQTVAVGIGQKVPIKFGPVRSSGPVGAGSATANSGEAPPGDGTTDGDSGGSANASLATDSPGLFSRPKTMVPVVLGGIVAVGGFATFGVFAFARQSAMKNAETVEQTIRSNGGNAGTCASDDAAVVRKFGKACEVLADNREIVNTNSLLANVGLGVGVGGAVIALGWYLFAPKKQSEPAHVPPTAYILPSVGPGYSGFSAGGTF
jgi:hypothetical protein